MHQNYIMTYTYSKLLCSSVITQSSILLPVIYFVYRALGPSPNNIIKRTQPCVDCWGGSDPEEFLSFLVGDLVSMHAQFPTSRLLLVLRLTFTHFLGICQPARDCRGHSHRPLHANRHRHSVTHCSNEPVPFPTVKP